MDSPISRLPAADPLDGSETFCCVQGGVTVKTRLPSSGGTTLTISDAHGHSSATVNLHVVVNGVGDASVSFAGGVTTLTISIPVQAYFENLYLDTTAFSVPIPPGFGPFTINWDTPMIQWQNGNLQLVTIPGPDVDLLFDSTWLIMYYHVKGIMQWAAPISAGTQLSTWLVLNGSNVPLSPILIQGATVVSADLASGFVTTAFSATVFIEPDIADSTLQIWGEHTDPVNSIPVIVQWWIDRVD